jgi:hypothetical protein
MAPVAAVIGSAVVTVVDVVGVVLVVDVELGSVEVLVVEGWPGWVGEGSGVLDTGALAPVEVSTVGARVAQLAKLSAATAAGAAMSRCSRLVWIGMLPRVGCWVTASGVR